MKKDRVVYFHINPINNEVFYVGIGDIRRPYVKSNRTDYWKRTVAKYGYEVIIVESNLTLEEAKEEEIFYIKYFGRRDLGTGKLINFTNGGGGKSGPMSEECKRKIGIANRKSKLNTDNMKKPKSVTTNMGWEKGRPWTEARRLAQIKRNINNE